MWHSIPNYSKYEINEDGRVRNLKTGKILTVRLNKNPRNPKGYYVYDLYNDAGIKKSLKRSRLVAFAFIPNPDGLREVDHIDSDTHNDSIDNLQWISRQDNHNKDKHKSSAYHSSNVKSEVLRYLSMGLKGSEINKLTGVSPATISRWKSEGSTTSL